MDMNPVEGLGASRKPMPLEPRKASRASAPQTPPGAASDSVEFSDDARKLAEGTAGAGASPGGQAPSEERIAAARQKLLSGQLSDPAAYAKTAEKLLRSGDLEKVKEDDADATQSA